MNAPPTQRRLTSLYRRRLTTFQSRLAAYLDAPNANCIHRARTSYRRLEVAYLLFPADIRTPATKRYFRTAKSFFRVNSVLRDCDIIEKRIGDSSDPAAGRLVVRLHQIRSRALAKALRSASMLANLPSPRLDCDDQRLAMRLRILVGSHASAVLPFTTAILADAVESHDLHEMRKHAKKLFYLLELDHSLTTPKRVRLIRRFQRLSGRVHDHDVTLEFLFDGSGGTDNLANIIARVIKAREKSIDRLYRLLEIREWRQLVRRGVPS